MQKKEDWSKFFFLFYFKIQGNVTHGCYLYKKEIKQIKKLIRFIESYVNRLPWVLLMFVAR